MGTVGQIKVRQEARGPVMESHATAVFKAAYGEELKAIKKDFEGESEVRGDRGECDFMAAQGDGGVQEGTAYSVGEHSGKARF